MTYNNLVKSTFVNKGRLFIFCLHLIPSEFRNSQYSYFHDNIFICISSVRICSHCNKDINRIGYTTKVLNRNVISERDVHGVRYGQAALRNCLKKINLGTFLQGSGKTVFKKNLYSITILAACKNINIQVKFNINILVLL